jgi:Mrp family chromosome partitioning ATPase
VVICDAPPTLPVPDVELIAGHVGVCMPVVRAGWTPRAAFRDLLEHLPEAKVIGVFLNHARLSRHERRYAYYHQDEAGDDAPADGE